MKNTQTNVEVGPDVTSDAERSRRKEAAYNLKEMLDTKKRGDHVTALEIAEATGFDEWWQFRDQVRRHLRKRGFYVNAIPNDGYRISLPHDQINDASRLRLKACRTLSKGVVTIASVPTIELTDAQQRKYDFEVARLHAQHQMAKSHEQESQKKFKTSERVPFRALVGGKSSTDDK